MQKLPRIQRFNEEVDTYSVVSKSYNTSSVKNHNKQIEDFAST